MDYRNGLERFMQMKTDSPRQKFLQEYLKDNPDAQRAMIEAAKGIMKFIAKAMSDESGIEVTVSQIVPFSVENELAAIAISQEKIIVALFKKNNDIIVKVL